MEEGVQNILSKHYPFPKCKYNNLWVKKFYKLCLKCEMLDVQVIAKGTLMKFQASC